MKVKSECVVAQLCPTLHDPTTAAYQAPLPMGFSRQEYWSGLPLPSPLLHLGLHNSEFLTSVISSGFISWNSSMKKNFPLVNYLITLEK